MCHLLLLINALENDPERGTCQGIVGNDVENLRPLYVHSSSSTTQMELHMFGDPTSVSRPPALLTGQTCEGNHLRLSDLLE
jgi:hypothetical protein